MALASCPAQQRSLRRTRQVLSWALARSSGGSQLGVGAVGVFLGGGLVQSGCRRVPG
jgi:hypothetical protein